MALFPAEINTVTRADRGRIVQAIAAFKRRAQPDWLSASNIFPDGIPPRNWNRAREIRHLFLK